MPWSNDQVDVISDDESASDIEIVDANNGLDGQQSINDITIDQLTKEPTSEGISFGIQDLRFAFPDKCFFSLDHQKVT